jgi:hypothetical protein
MATLGTRKKHAFPRLQPGRRQGAPAWWAYLEGPRRTFAGDAGDVADLMRNAPAGVRAAGCTWDRGPRGPCLTFNGTTGKVTAAKAIAGPPFYASCWFLVTSKANYLALINCRDASFVGLFLSDKPGNPLTAAWNNNSTEYSAATGLAVSTGKWYFGAFAVTPTATTTYLGDPAAGTLQSFTLAEANAARTNTNWTFGCDPGIGGDFLPGSLDDLRLHAYAPTAQQVARDFADPDWRLRGRRKLFASAAAVAVRRSLTLTGCGS